MGDVISSDLFRFVSLRGPSDELTIDPSEFVRSSDALKVLENTEVDILDPGRSTLDRLRGVPLLDTPDLARFTLSTLAQKLEHDPTYSSLSRVGLDVEGRAVTFHEIERLPAIQEEVRRVFDSWLVLTLSRAQPARDAHARLLRAAYLVHLAATDPARLKAKGAISRLLRALVLLPKSWRASRYRHAATRRKQSDLLSTRPPAATSRRAETNQVLKTRHQELTLEIRQLERIQATLHRTYARSGHHPQPERPAATLALSGARPRFIPAEFYREAERELTPDQRIIFRRRLEGGQPAIFDDVIGLFATEAVADEANLICSEIRAIAAADEKLLPVAIAPQQEMPPPVIRSMGWGQLVVARERLIGYQAREIAHIENVLRGESKLREHERKTETQEIVETETVTERTTEKDSQTTDRYELQADSQETIQTDFSIATGVNASGRYGLTTVEMSLDAAFTQSESESRSSSTSMAKEIVAKAVEKTFERVRELRRLTVTEQIREFNRHELTNPANPNGEHISGMYLWVEKLHEVELRHYGKRLMVEFHIPEPAVSLLEKRRGAAGAQMLPPFDVAPDSIHAGNYMCLAQRYAAVDVAPPPPQWVKAALMWNTTPTESEEENAEDTLKDTIVIPGGYRPFTGEAIVSAFKPLKPGAVPAWAEGIHIHLTVGGKKVVHVTDSQGLEHPQMFEFDRSVTWPAGVPVSAWAHGHFDKTMTLQIVLTCERTSEAFATWQLRTWEQLRNGYLDLGRSVEQANQRRVVAEELGIVIEGLPESENRRIEREELQKWAIKAMRLNTFDFNAVEQVGDRQEISPFHADMQAPIVRFFEEAFEWREMTYFLHPYYWARRDTWRLRQDATATDPRFKAFLAAGAARVIVPVTPGYEARVLRYVEADAGLGEIARIEDAQKAAKEVPFETAYEDLWIEILTSRHDDMARGSGTLQVVAGDARVRLNDDSKWEPQEPRDVGRELFIDGAKYQVIAVLDGDGLQLDRPFEGATKDSVSYAAGSVPFGPPWVAAVPTTLVILSTNREQLKELADS